MHTHKRDALYHSEVRRIDHAVEMERRTERRNARTPQGLLVTNPPKIRRPSKHLDQRFHLHAHESVEAFKATRLKAQQIGHALRLKAFRDAAAQIPARMAKAGTDPSRFLHSAERRRRADAAAALAAKPKRVRATKTAAVPVTDAPEVAALKRKPRAKKPVEG